YGGFRYVSYDGAWGLDGDAAEPAYLDRTAYWVGIFRRGRGAQPYPRHTQGKYPGRGTAAPTGSRPPAPPAHPLTVARLIVIPIYAVLILRSVNGHSWAAAILFALAAITDQIDGFLARRWHVESRFGKIADPLADRLLIDVAVVLLWHAGQLPWAAFLIPARDVLLIVLTPFALRRGYEFEV